MSTNAKEDVSPAEKLLTMTLGMAQTQLLSVAAQLKLADRLKDGPQSVETLAEATGMHPPSFARLMAALAHMGLLAETAPGQFSCTAMGALLQTDASHSMRHVAMLYGGEWFTNAWPQLLESVRTGTSAFESAFGMNVYAYFEKNPAARDVFQHAMSNFSNEEGIAIRDNYDFSLCRTVVDVGGGYGQLLAILLQALPSLTGVLFDVPAVVEGARQALQSEPFNDRCDFVGGDFMTAAPAGGDVYILKRILMDRTDEQVCTLLRNIRRAMALGGRVLVAEPDTSCLYGRLLDIHMLVNFGSRLRTDTEVQALLVQSGFKPGRAIGTGSSTSLRLLEGI